jgi:hypothetical protein
VEQRPPLWTSVAAAVMPAPLAAGVFLMLHEWWISPIWNAAGQAIGMSCGTGIAFGIAFHFTDARRRPALFGIAMWLAIAPAMLSSTYLRPFGGYYEELIGGLATLLLGALAGWLTRRTRAAAISCAIAAVGVVAVTAPSASFLRTERGLKIYLALLPLMIVYALTTALLARIFAAGRYSARV